MLTACGGYNDEQQLEAEAEADAEATVAPAATDNTMTLAWSAPSANADGTPNTDLASYRVMYGTASGTYSTAVAISNPNTLTYTISGLAPGTYYAVVTAVDSLDNESTPSAEVSKTIR